MRLQAVVQAPLERIDEIIERNPILQKLFGNGWVACAARAEAGRPWQRWTRSGWRPWNNDMNTEVTENTNNTEEMVR